MRAHEVLAHLYNHPGRGPAAVARALGDTNARAVQRVLARLREQDPPLVRAEGTKDDRRYYLTEAGVRQVEGRNVRIPPPPDPPAVVAPTPADAPRPAVTPERAALQRVSALLTTHGVPAVEEGRQIPIEERVRRALDERDAADTRIDDELRRRAFEAFASDPRYRFLSTILKPDEMLRAVLEAGVAALAAAPTPEGTSRR